MNRDDLKRRAREAKPHAGVYQIRNLRDGRVLVERTPNLKTINGRQMELRQGKHRNARLQADVRLLGADAFVFEVLDTLTPPDQPDYDPIPDLTVLEDLWLEKLSLSPDRLHTIAPGRLARPPR